MKCIWFDDNVALENNGNKNWFWEHCLLKKAHDPFFHRHTTLWLRRLQKNAYSFAYVIKAREIYIMLWFSLTHSIIPSHCSTSEAYSNKDRILNVIRHIWLYLNQGTIKFKDKASTFCILQLTSQILWDFHWP